MKAKLLIITLALFFTFSNTFTQGTWTQKANFGGTARQTARGFSIGTKGYIGTGFDGALKKDFWEWDQATNVWTQKADFGGAARDGAVALSIGGKGYIGFGTIGYPTYNFVKDFWEYDPSANSWIQKAVFPGTARYGLVGITIGNKAYLGLGWNQTAPYFNDWWEYDQSNDTWTQKTNFGGAARQSAIGIAINGKGYVGTGYNGSMLKDFWEYDPINNSWMQKADVGGTTRGGGAAFTIDNTGYVGLGNATYPSPDYQKDLWKYSPDSNSWSQVVDFAGTARAGGPVAFTIGNLAYIGTGYDGAYRDDFWEFSPQQDTCFIAVYDTVLINDTIVFYDTLTFFDTVSVYDTTIIYDTATVNDTIVFYDTLLVTVYDTLVIYDSIAVTDTLIIDVPLGLTPPDDINTLKIYPNPAHDHIVIDNGDFALMTGYKIAIENSIGQQVFFSLINQQQFDIDLSGWTGNGTYFVYIRDSQNNLKDVRKIILQ